MTLSIDIPPQGYDAPTPAKPYSSLGAPENAEFWGKDGFSFKSLLDILNPLQHIPVVSTIYQTLTGDVPSPGANLAGGALVGGPIGFAAALFNEIVQSQSGKDIGGNVLALINGEATSETASNYTPDPTPFLSPNQRSVYNAYVRTQSLTA